MHKTPSKRSTDTELGLKPLYLEPRGIDQSVLIHKCRPKTSRAKMWDPTVPRSRSFLKLNTLPSTFVVSYRANPLSIGPKMQTTCPWEMRLLWKGIPCPTGSEPHFGYLSHPKAQPRHPHRNVCSPPNTTLVLCSPGPRAQGGQPSTASFLSPSLTFIPSPLPETQLLPPRGHLALSEVRPKLRGIGPKTSHGLMGKY